MLICAASEAGLITVYDDIRIEKLRNRVMHWVGPVLFLATFFVIIFPIWEARWSISPHAYKDMVFVGFLFGIIVGCLVATAVGLTVEAWAVRMAGKKNLQRHSRPRRSAEL